jgi:hypothetical protein
MATKLVSPGARESAPWSALGLRGAPGGEGRGAGGLPAQAEEVGERRPRWRHFGEVRAQRVHGPLERGERELLAVEEDLELKTLVEREAELGVQREVVQACRVAAHPPRALPTTPRVSFHEGRIRGAYPGAYPEVRLDRGGGGEE